MKNIVIIFSAILGLAAAAFFPHPAMPHQIIDIPRGGTFLEQSKENAAFIDAGLDNPDIQEDGNITPARKCGFCLG